MSHPSAQCLCVHEKRTLDKVLFHDLISFIVTIKENMFVTFLSDVLP